LRTAATALLAALLLAASGCAHAALVSRSGMEVPAGKFAEANLLLRAGDTITWDWSASQVVHFNVHTHQAGGATELVAQDAASNQGSFTAPQAGGYSLLWENGGGAAVTLEYSVQGAGKVESVYPA
jgi:plastocyanin